MTEANTELLQKLKGMGVVLHFHWKKPPTFTCESGEEDVCEFILDYVRPTKNEWLLIQPMSRTVGTRTTPPSEPKPKKIMAVIRSASEYRYV